MFMTRGLLLILMAFSLAALGCSNSATATLSPGVDLSTVKSYYVVHQPKDTRNLHLLVRDRIVKEGLTATAGPESQKAAHQVNSIVTYVDRWMWDITLYLLELTVTFRDTNEFPLAVGKSYHSSLTRLSPEEMVEEVITNIFKGYTKGYKSG